MENEDLYSLGIRAQKGDENSLMKIINKKRKMIQRYSFGDEDRYEYIIERLIIRIKNYKF